MKGPEEVCKAVSDEQQSRFGKRRDFTLSSVNNICHLTYEQAKMTCMARKRKERQESVSSISQERKVIRSNSEERPLETKAQQTDEIRRVSSHEDFNKKPDNNKNGSFYNYFRCDVNVETSPHKDVSVHCVVYDDYENEKRRSHERFSRAAAPTRGRRITGKKPSPKQFSKSRPKTYAPKIVDELDKTRSAGNEFDLESLLRLHQEETRRTPSPEPPSLDLSTLHEQIDCGEPILSITSQEISEQTDTLPSSMVASSRLLSSPRNSIIMTHRIYLDPEVPNFNSMKEKEKNPVEQRMRELSKQMNSLKKKIKRNEEEFEMKFGYKPSHADKMSDKTIKKLYSDLNQVKKEHKQLKDDPIDSPNGKEEQSRISGIKLQDTLSEIEKRLNARCVDSDKTVLLFEQMTTEQLMEEKVSMQKALLYLESLHGRPSSKEDRDLVRPLYDKYRILKRLIAKNSMPNANVELATIHEDETMNFVSTPPKQITETDSERTQLTATSTDSDTDTSIGENLHSLTRTELLSQQKAILEEKKELRRSLRLFEDDIQSKTGRKIQKDDKLPMENVYVSYKKAKAKLRLIEALLNKQAL